MAKLPDATMLGDRPRLVPNTGVVSFNPNTGNEDAPAKALGKLSTTVDSVMQEMERQQLQNDKLRAEDAYNKLLNRRVDLSSGDDGFVHKKSGDAVNQPIMQDYTKRFDDAVNEISETLGNDRQKEEFRRRASIANTQFKSDILNHVTREQEVYAGQVFKGSIETEAQAAISRRLDPNGVALSMERINGVIDAEAARAGWPKEKIQDAKFDATSGVHTGIVSQFIADGNTNAARAYFDEHKNEISTDKQLHLLGMFKSKSAEIRVEVSDKVRDMEAMALRGVVPPPDYVSSTDIGAAYPDNPQKAKQVQRQVQRTYQFARDVGAMNGMDNDQLVKFVTETKSPSVTRPEDFAEEAERQDKMKIMAQRILNERQNNPLAYAQQNNIGFVRPIDMSNPDAMSDEMINRQQTAKVMTSRFGSPYVLMTKQEAGQFSAVMDQLPYTQRLEYMKNMSAKLDPGAYKSVMQQIRPDSPVTAMVGNLMDKGTHNVRVAKPLFGIFGKDEFMDPTYAATRMAQGEDILNPKKGDKAMDGKPKFAMPSDKDLRAAWTDLIGDAYRDVPRTEDAAYQAFRAFYAGEAAHRGKYDGIKDDDITRRAALAATGGVIEFNGGSVVPPWGMAKDEFYSKASEAIKKSGLSDKYNVNNIMLDTVDDGEYVVKVGSGPVMSKEGRPVHIFIR